MLGSSPMVNECELCFTLRFGIWESLCLRWTLSRLTRPSLILDTHARVYAYSTRLAYLARMNVRTDNTEVERPDDFTFLPTYVRSNAGIRVHSHYSFDAQDPRSRGYCPDTRGTCLDRGKMQSHSPPITAARCILPLII